MDGPDQIGPDYSPKRTFSDKLRYVAKTFTTRYATVNIVTTGNLVTDYF
jgi:hypothetical protein